MSSLTVYHQSNPDVPNKVLTHLEDIAATLAEVGVRFERWKAAVQGVEPLRELRAATDKLQADRLVYLALSPLSDSANAFAKEQNIVVLDGTGMATLIAKNTKA